jgi:hypothetical protein
MKELKVLILIIVGLIVLIPLASSEPDGLEKTIESLGIEEEESSFSAVMPEYNVRGIQDPFISTAISGIIGILLILGIGLIVGKYLSKRSIE